MSYGYDSLNRLREIQQNGTPWYTYTYTGVNPLVQSLTRPNGNVTTYQYDLLNRLTEIANKNSSAEMINQHVSTYNNQDMRGSETISRSTLPLRPGRGCRRGRKTMITMRSTNC